MPVFKKSDKNVLFAHVPKTGGTSIEKSFEVAGYGVYYRDGKSGRGTLNDLRICTPQHMHAKMLTSYFDVKKFDLIFMCVRDPVSRLKSEYCMKNQHKPWFDLSSQKFGEWVERVFTSYNNDKAIYDNHIRPQKDFYIPGSKVVKFENGLSDGVNVLSEKYSLNVELGPDRFNDRSQFGYSSSDVECDDFTLEEIYMFYNEDYLFFDYKV